MPNPRNCHYWASKQCKYKDHEIIKLATQDIPEVHGSYNPKHQDPPTTEEILSVCGTCDKFTPIKTYS